VVTPRAKAAAESANGKKVSPETEIARGDTPATPRAKSSPPKSAGARTAARQRGHLLLWWLIGGGTVLVVATALLIWHLI
jgi:hypothetical protein